MEYRSNGVLEHWSIVLLVKKQLNKEPLNVQRVKTSWVSGRRVYLSFVAPNE
jgi:hypothetical protein